jgi:hypothetical protein
MPACDVCGAPLKSGQCTAAPHTDEQTQAWIARRWHPEYWYGNRHELHRIRQFCCRPEDPTR